MLNQLSKKLSLAGVAHTLVRVSTKAEIRRESDGKLFSTLIEKPKEPNAEFTKRIIDEARKIEKLLGDPCLIHFAGVTFQLGKDGKLKPSYQRISKIQDNKLIRSI
jgi:hypothetical protein